MTEKLDTAIAGIAALLPQEQDHIAQLLLEELADMAAWKKQFSESQNALSSLAAEARRERTLGRTEELDPDQL